VNPYFKRLINTLKQMNYSDYKSEAFNKFGSELTATINERKAA
jgi:V/A-type H+-transporting ATPase subunit A